MGQGDTLINAAIGTAVTVLLSFTGFSPLLGGGVAGYLQRDGRTSGAKVGAVSGLLASVLFLVFIVLFFGLFLVGIPAAGGGVMPGLPGGVELLVVLGIFVPFTIAWNVGLGALGGYAGAYIYEDRDGPSEPAEAVH
jgi:hypothetical protein